MMVGVVESGSNNTDTGLSQVMSQLSLEIPKTVALDPTAAPVVGFDKMGADLNVEFSDGERLHIKDFFVIGPDGDFSRLASPSGEIIVTGLMGPEPEGFALTEQSTVPLDGAHTANDAGDNVSHHFAEAAGGGADWPNSAMLAAAGISVGSGIGALSGGSSAGSAAPAAASTPDAGNDLAVLAGETDEELATMVAELTGGEPFLLQPEDFDTEDLIADAIQSDQNALGFVPDGSDVVPSEGFVGTQGADFHAQVLDEFSLLDILSDVTAEVF